MKRYIALGMALSLVVVLVGCWYRYSREYYHPKGLSNLTITHNNGLTRIAFTELPESVYYASGAQIIDENASQIIVSIVLENIHFNRKTQFPTKGNLTTGHYVEIPNPKNKVCIVE